MVDYLIIGQGIAGSVLAWKLLKAGKRVLVINNKLTNQASQVAAGMYNPISGRYLAKTWLADQLFPSMEAFYSEVASMLAVPLLYPQTIFRPFLSHQEQELWLAKPTQEVDTPYVSLADSHYQAADIFNQYGGIIIKQAGHLDVPCFLATIRAYLQANNCYREADFDYNKLQFSRLVRYQDIQAHQLIFCEGAQAKKNPFFSYLPFRLVKGELLTIQLPKKLDRIYNRGVFILPKPNEQAIIGATYDWRDLSIHPTEKAQQVLQARLEKLLRLPYAVVSQKAGIRPATFDRKPWVGLHPDYPQIGIFNGLGTKGVSLAPYLAATFVDYLLDQQALPAPVQLSRVTQKTNML